MDENRQTIAYFSMEIAVDVSMPTYSGGLGVLAGGTSTDAVPLEIDQERACCVVLSVATDNANARRAMQSGAKA
jgi:hypothetical protein